MYGIEQMMRATGKTWSREGSKLKIGVLVRIGESHDEVRLPEQIVTAVDGLVQKAALAGQLNHDVAPACRAARDTLYHEIACFVRRREQRAVTTGQEQAIEALSRQMRTALNSERRSG